METESMKIKIIVSFFALILIALNGELTIFGEPIQSGLIRLSLPDSTESVWLGSQPILIHNSQCYLGFSRTDSLRQKVIFESKSGFQDTITIIIQEREYNIQYIHNIPQEYVEKPKSEALIERIKKEYETISAVRKNIIHRNQNVYFSAVIRPVEGKISSFFGDQRILNGTPKRPHYGLDIAAPKGALVRACTSGVVVLTGEYFYNGKFVLIDHGLGLSSIYIHLDQIHVHIGQAVSTETIIGTVGSSGRSTGAHLHWGFYWFDKALDPELVLDNYQEN